MELFKNLTHPNSQVYVLPKYGGIYGIYMNHFTILNQLTYFHNLENNINTMFSDRTNVQKSRNKTFFSAFYGQRSVMEA